jgi:hypothetical protein
MEAAIETNRVAIGIRVRVGVESGVGEEEIADVQGGEAVGEARDITMANTATASGMDNET